MSWLLAPVSLAYGAAMGARAWWYRRGGGRVRSLACPVVSVGNLSLGGTGKTPMVIALGEALLARGVGVTVLSRGYRGAYERSGGLASDGAGGVRAGWADAGDEPALIARRLPGAVVMVGARRGAVWTRFGAGLSPGVCILDDGFQHLAIARDENLLLLDATESASYETDALVPRGRLREPLDALERASMVVVTRGDQAPKRSTEVIERLVRARVPAMPILQARFEPVGLEEIGSGRREPIVRLKGMRVLATAGIGRFESFVTLLRHAGAVVVGTMPYRDHHVYRRTDIEAVTREAHDRGAEQVVTTEKDAVKLETLLTASHTWWAVRLETRITPETPWRALLDRLVAKVRS